MTRNRNILVTGGGGYIGSHAVIELINRGYSVVVVDDLESCYSSQGQKPEALKRIEDFYGTPITFYCVDILVTNDLSKILRECAIDCILHFAELKPDGDENRENVTMLLSLLDAMKQEDVKKLVLSSSAMVYGVPQYLPVTEEHPTGLNLTDELHSRSKYIMEEHLKELCDTDPSWKVIFLRFYDAVGAHESGIIGEDTFTRPPNLFLLISEVALGKRDRVQITRNEYDAINEEGFRDYLHVTDVALAHILAMEKLEESSFRGWKAYNLGNGHGCPVVKVIERFSVLSEQTITTQIVEEPPKAFGRYVNGSMAKQELGWQITKSFDDMCLDTIRWQRQNPNGYRNS